MTQNVEIFKALRIITIMLFCAKTKKKPNTLHTGCFISPFATNPNKKSFFFCLSLKQMLLFSALLWRQREASPHILWFLYKRSSLRRGQRQKGYNHFFQNILCQIYDFWSQVLAQFFFFFLYISICRSEHTRTPPGGALLNSTTRWRRSRATRRLCCSSTVASL